MGGADNADALRQKVIVKQQKEAQERQRRQEEEQRRERLLEEQKKAQEQKRLQEKQPEMQKIQFKMIDQRDKIPVGWKLASIEDVIKHREKANAAVNQMWAICTLQDGKIAGYGYYNAVDRGSFNDL